MSGACLHPSIIPIFCWLFCKSTALLKPLSFLVMRARIFVFFSDGGRFHPLFRSCHFEALPPQLLVMYKNVSIVVSRVSFHLRQHPPMHTSYQVKNYRSRGSKEIKLSHTAKKYGLKKHTRSQHVLRVRAYVKNSEP